MPAAIPRGAPPRTQPPDHAPPLALRWRRPSRSSNVGSCSVVAAAVVVRCVSSFCCGLLMRGRESRDRKAKKSSRAGLVVLHRRPSPLVASRVHTQNTDHDRPRTRRHLLVKGTRPVVVVLFFRGHPMTSPTVVLARSSCCDAYLSNRDKLFNGLARIPKAASTSCLFYDDSSKSLSRSLIFIFFSFLFCCCIAGHFSGRTERESRQLS